MRYSSTLAYFKKKDNLLKLKLLSQFTLKDILPTAMSIAKLDLN